jgi:hypothetical protein
MLPSLLSSYGAEGWKEKSACNIKHYSEIYFKSNANHRSRSVKSLVRVLGLLPS